MTATTRQDIAPAIYNAGWTDMDCEDDGPGLIDLGDNTGWEDLDHSHASRVLRPITLTLQMLTRYGQLHIALSYPFAAYNS